MPRPIADDELIEALLAAAVAAGRAALDIYHAGFTVAHKADQSPVTAADHASEKIILEHLARVAPGVPVVAEEAAAAGSIPEVREEFSSSTLWMAPRSSSTATGSSPSTSR